MIDKQDNLQSFVVLGGGTAGWITAAILAQSLQNTGCKITLIESPDIPTVGVGEATIPSFVDMLKYLKIPQQDFIKKTNATFKLAIKFVDWLDKGHSYWHPFGLIGSKIDGKDFYQHWLKDKKFGGKSELTDFSPATALAKKNKFFVPDPQKPNNLSSLGFAYHLDAGLVADYLASYATNKGVVHVKANVNDASKDDEGNISHLECDNAEVVTGDFFFDCSGGRGFLIDGVLGVKYESWKKYLPVDSAVVMQTENEDELAPYTESIAHENGWRWRIPLQNRTGNGYVYSSDYCDDQSATELLARSVVGAPLTEPRVLRFNTGKREKFWHKNCLSVGLSSGFIEPLESTAIYLIMRSVLNFVKMLPDRRIDPVTINEYNRLMDEEYISIRDFVVLHYCVTRRTDSPFWQSWSSREIPKSLATKIALFKSQGRLYKNDSDLFSTESWYSVLEGMGVRPSAYDPVVDASNFEKVKIILADGARDLAESTKKTPSHRNFVEQIVGM